MTNLFIANSPLQYLIAQIIAEEFFSQDKNILIHNVNQGDFSETFEQVDQLRCRSCFAQRITYIPRDDTLPQGPIDRAFFSNRFNATEARIFRQLNGRADKICGFEDGIAFYLSHYFLDPRRHDRSKRARLEAVATRMAEQVGLLPRGKTRDFFPMARYDEVYSVLPDVPGVRADAKRVSLEAAFKVMGGKIQTPTMNCCLVLSQSLVEDGLVERTSYRRFIEEQLARLSQQYSTVYFKAHPREQDAYSDLFDDLGCQHLPDGYASTPAELFIATHPGIDVYGYWSTTLAYGQLLSAASVSFGAALLRANPENRKLQSSWQTHAPILHRFGVTDWS